MTTNKERLTAGWKRTCLKDVCEFIRGVSFDKADVRTLQAVGYLPILRSGNIRSKLDLINDLIWVPNRYVSPEQRLKKGDIAICMSSGSPDVVGKTAQLKESWDGSVGAFCGIIRPRQSELIDYLGLWFRSSEFIAWRDEQARGANIQNLRFSQLELLEIPLPPRSQSAILTQNSLRVYSKIVPSYSFF